MQNLSPPHGGAEAAPDIVCAPAFDFAEPAELFTRRNPSPKIAAGRSQSDADRARSRATYRNALAYRRFATAAEAIRFAIEEISAEALGATVLVVNGDRHDPAAIRAMYADAAFPLKRRDGSAC